LLLISQFVTVLEERLVQKTWVSGSEEEAISLLKTMPWALVEGIEGKKRLVTTTDHDGWDFKVHEVKA